MIPGLSAGRAVASSALVRPNYPTQGLPQGAEQSRASGWRIERTGSCEGLGVDCGANGGSVVGFIRSSQAHWCLERCFPLTPALSLGERERGSTRFRQSRAPRLVAARDALFPLPKGEGKGEGERDAANRNGQTIIAGSNRLARRGRIGYHIEPRACRWSKGARSQTHRCFERAFPLTPPSPLGRGRTEARLLKNSAGVAIRSRAAGDETAAIRCPAITPDR